MSIPVNNMNTVNVSWDEIPEEYEWFAIDGFSGKGNVYRTEPFISSTIHDSWNIGGSFLSWPYEGHYTNWKETLQQRPKKVVTLQENTDYSVHIHLDSDTDSLTYCGRLSKEQVIKIMKVIYEEKQTNRASTSY